MTKSLVICTLLFFCVSCSHKPESIDDDGLDQYIRDQKEFIAISDTNLPHYIKIYQPLILDFLKSKGLKSGEYFVSTEVHSYTEDDKFYCDTSETHLSLHLYHSDYFSILYRDHLDFLKDSTITMRKGNIGGKNFSIGIDKLKNTISGPGKWK